MRVFVTGSTGWIGSAVIPELIGAGHRVLGLVRSDASAAKVAAMGGEALRGDMEDAEILRAGAAQSDGVVHLAFNHDFTQFAEAVAADARAIRAMGKALEGSGNPLVIASGTPAVPGRAVSEDDAADSEGPAAARGENAQTTIELAARGVRSSVVRLPRSVHGDGDRDGLIPRLIGIDRDRGESVYIADGADRWPAVHRLDAAHLFRLALEEAPAGSVLHAVDDEGVPIREIAEVISRHLHLPTASVDAEELGFFGQVLAIDQPASSRHTRELLGWQPTQRGLLEDLEHGDYFD